MARTAKEQRAVEAAALQAKRVEERDIKTFVITAGVYIEDLETLVDRSFRFVKDWKYLSPADLIRQARHLIDLLELDYGEPSNAMAITDADDGQNANEYALEADAEKFGGALLTVRQIDDLEGLIYKYFAHLSPDRANPPRAIDLLKIARARYDELLQLKKRSRKIATREVMDHRKIGVAQIWGEDAKYLIKKYGTNISYEE